MKTVAIISMSRSASDGRILRHISALTGHFHVVTIGFGPSPSGVVSHIEIPSAASYLPINLRAIVPHLLRLYRLSSSHTAAVSFVADHLRRAQYDLLLLNDVQTLPLLDQFSGPAIVDMHEYAPREMEEDWRFRVLLMRYYHWLCSRYLPLAAKVVTVSPGLAREFRHEFGVACHLVMNAREQHDLPIRRTDPPPMRLVHSGLAASARRLEIMIEAVDGLPGVTLDMYLVAAPRQPATLRRLKHAASRTPNVRILDPVPSRELPHTINRYDLALIYLAPDNFSIRHSMPNKLFDSVQARVGVVTGPSPDMAGFVAAHGIGRSTEVFTAESLRALISSLGPSEVDRFKEASDAVARSFHAAAEGEKLAAIALEIV